jgi:hypothetical protein
MAQTSKEKAGSSRSTSATKKPSSKSTGSKTTTKR